MDPRLSAPVLSSPWDDYSATKELPSGSVQG